MRKQIKQALTGATEFADLEVCHSPTPEQSDDSYPPDGWGKCEPGRVHARRGRVWSEGLAGRPAVGHDAGSDGAERDVGT